MLSRKEAAVAPPLSMARDRDDRDEKPRPGGERVLFDPRALAPFFAPDDSSVFTTFGTPQLRVGEPRKTQMRCRKVKSESRTIWRRGPTPSVFSRCRSRIIHRFLVLHLLPTSYHAPLFYSLFSIISYAPWCPACKALEPVWEHLASAKKDLDINVGKIDVTNSPGLSGRFMVTALPTIFQ